MIHKDLSIPGERIEAFCLKHHIRKISLFGSCLREDFGPESDVDFLVEFEPGRTPGLIRITRMEMELSELLNGRKVDLRMLGDLSRYFREEVRATAIPQYEHIIPQT